MRIHLNGSQYKSLLWKVEEVQVKELDFHDGFIMRDNVKIYCRYSKNIYNFIKYKTDAVLELSLFDKSSVYISNMSLRRICGLLDDIYNGKNTIDHNAINASLLDFYDGYIVYDGKMIEEKRSKFMYNAFKKLDGMPLVTKTLERGILLLSPLLDELERCEKQTSHKNIKAYFSEKVMQLGVNGDCLRVETSGNFQFLRHSYQYLPNGFVRDYIDKGCDLNELPLYILQVNSENMENMINEVMDGLSWDGYYPQLLEIDNIPDVLLGKLVVSMKLKSNIERFVKLLQSSMLFTPTHIDSEFHGYTINLQFMEKVQNGGSSLKDKCSFRQEAASLLLELKDKKIMLLSKNRHRSSIVFEYKTEQWQTVLYFLYSFYSSDCRYKRSYPPISLLSEFGVMIMRRAYKTEIENRFVTRDWFLIKNKRSQMQLLYSKEAYRIKLIDI